MCMQAELICLLLLSFFDIASDQLTPFLPFLLLRGLLVSLSPSLLMLPCDCVTPVLERLLLEPSTELRRRCILTDSTNDLRLDSTHASLPPLPRKHDHH